jgi:Ran GTPase-activating protein (RanGAP) involved in mRNA processing and transport
MHAGGALQLHTLLFFNCGISANVRRTFSDFIQRMPSLVSIEFNASRSHALFGGLVETIAPPLLALTNLESLQVSGQELKQSEVEDMSVCLRSLHEPRLRNLLLPFNSIRAAGAQALAQALPALTNLEKLDLTRNTIAPSGAEAIAEALPACSRLVLLDLWANGVSDIGAVAISRALSMLPSLLFLDLCLNRIGDTGAIALAAALQDHMSLRSLNLDNNLVCDEGALILARALTRVGSFGTLFLCRNRLSYEGKLAVESILMSAVRVQSFSARMSQNLQDTLL